MIIKYIFSKLHELFILLFKSIENKRKKERKKERKEKNTNALIP